MTPDLAPEHVTGIRIFKFHPEKILLSSLTTNGGPENYFWLPGEVKRSVCGFMPPHHRQLHTQPEKDCTCGIWSCKSRKFLAMAFQPSLSMAAQGGWFREFFYSAQIEQWGVVVEHEGGYRSEFARIIPETIQIWPRPRDIKKYAKLTTFLRQKYDPIPSS